MRDIRTRTIHSGPLVLYMKLTLEEVEQIKKLCKKDKKKDFRKQLAGIIKHEYEVDINKASRILYPYWYAYSEVHKTWYGKAIEGSLSCTAGWVNYMQAGDCNPIHVHTDCQFSCVLFLHVSKNLQEERKKHIASGAKPGSLIFTLRAPQEQFHITEYETDKIEAGDFYVFPHNVLHSVPSFRSKGERVTASFNLDIKK